MPWLLLVSLIWAFSFGLIKGRLTGVDPALVSFVRMALALLVFVPLLRPRGLRTGEMVGLAAIGAVQFGLMYVCYIAAFATLKAYEVAALTIFTPVFVALLDAAATRRLALAPIAAALLAVAGAGVIVIDKPLAEVSWRGVLLVQASNLCFALGQVAWRRWRIRRPDTPEAGVFALPCLGAVLVTGLLAAPALPSLATLGAEAWLTLVYLGLVASGAGFFLWNYGASRTDAGSLAVANNIKIPLAVACAILLFGESGDPARLAWGGAIIVAAGLLADRAARRRPA